MHTKHTVSTYALLSIFSVIILPIYVILFLPPKFTELIVENTKNEAVMVTNNLVSVFIGEETNLANKKVLAALKKNDARLKKDFFLTKLKLFLPTGKIVYSSDPEDIGKINERDYFFDIVAKGNIYAKLVKKETQSLEGQIMQADVVETYVPIIKDDVLVGAFEIYYDITQTMEKLDKLMAHIYVVLLLISGSLLCVIVISTIKAKRSIAERKEYERKLRKMAITDDLTGLLNRRGFVAIAEKQMSISERKDELLFLLYADVDGLKWINDNLGHDTGDQSLIETANIFRATFRKSDILCRLGGDEFAVLLTCPTDEDSEETIIKRFNMHLENFNKQERRLYNLQVSIGVTRCTAQKPCSLEELMKKADKLMYERKMRKKLNTLKD